MALTPGTRLGVYEVTTQIGAGGMGEVYRATDSNLKRSVAIKVLPVSVAGDADRLARFQREAEVLAALNHPNIGAIYGLEKTRDCTALVMELVEGDDLSQRIARGPIPLDEALPIAKQIAEALEAAHEQGIIHRDLKPANIKVRSDGTVKVLDFGLAKAIDPPSASNANAASSPTRTSATVAGRILGTPAYMAPEQARGQAVDKRVDIWAFGVVFYEMLTGRPPFAGDSVSDTLAAVLTTEPAWDRVPPAVRPLLQRCLAKDPKRRLRDIGDLDAAGPGRDDNDKVDREALDRVGRDPDGAVAAVRAATPHGDGEDRARPRPPVSGCAADRRRRGRPRGVSVPGHEPFRCRPPQVPPTARRVAPRATGMDAPVALPATCRGDDVGVRRRSARGAHRTVLAGHDGRAQVVLRGAPEHVGSTCPLPV